MATTPLTAEGVTLCNAAGAHRVARGGESEKKLVLQQAHAMNKYKFQEISRSHSFFKLGSHSRLAKYRDPLTEANKSIVSSLLGNSIVAGFSFLACADCCFCWLMCRLHCWSCTLNFSSFRGHIYNIVYGHADLSVYLLNQHSDYRFQRNIWVLIKLLIQLVTYKCWILNLSGVDEGFQRIQLW